MPNETKVSITKWITFAVSCLTIMLKVVHEIVDIIPQKGE